MSTALKSFLAAGLGLALANHTALGADELTTQKDKVSYAVGMSIGQNLKRSGFEVDVDLVAAGIKASLAGTPKLTEEEARNAINAYQTELRAKKEEERKQLAEKNRKLGAEFLAANKSKEGVKTHTVTMPDGTTSELQYKVIADGTGAVPKSNDTVTVNYRGTLIDGREFDSSIKRGQPAKFPVMGVIKGWTEALQLMKVGSKWQLFIPSELAYRDGGSGPLIEPGSTLIFEVELLSADAPAPPAAPQPLTSDIIRVPSADELKKGAKVEVLKPEDVEKMMRESTNKPAK